MAFAEDIHKHKPRDIKPQGAGSGLDADKVDGLHGHRKWSWVDEQTWIKSFVLPYSYQGWVDKGVVLDRGASGQWDDAYVGNVAVLIRNGTWYLFYTGYHVSWNDAQIGLATSTNGLNFTRDPSNPILTPPTGYTAVCNISVIYDEYETDVAKKWKMTGHMRNTAGVWLPFKCYGSGPKNWGAPTILNLPADHMYPAVIRVGNVYFFYTRPTSTTIHLLLTSDWVNFVDYGLILSSGATNEWDDAQITYPSPIYNTGIFYVAYSGYDGSTFRLGLALSGGNIPGFTYTKYPYNPTLDLGPGGSWYETHVSGSFITLLMKDDNFHIFVTGNDAAGVTRIGRFDLLPRGV